MVTAPLQFFSNRSFAGAGNAFDQIISDAHPVFSTTKQDWSSSAWLTACLPIFDHLHEVLNLPKPALAGLGFKLTHCQMATAIHSNGCINVESRDG
jgi:hypothetical protein